MNKLLGGFSSLIEKNSRILGYIMLFMGFALILYDLLVTRFFPITDDAKQNLKIATSFISVLLTCLGVIVTTVLILRMDNERPSKPHNWYNAAIIASVIVFVVSFFVSSIDVTVNGLACLGIAITILRPLQVQSYNSKLPPITGGTYIGDVTYSNELWGVEEKYCVIVVKLDDRLYGTYLLAGISNWETQGRVSRKEAFNISDSEDEAIGVGVTMLKDEKERLQAKCHKESYKKGVVVYNRKTKIT